MEDILQSFSTLASVVVKSIANDATHSLTHLIKHHTVAGEDVDHVIITLFPFDLSEYAPDLLLHEALDYLQHYPQYFLFNLHLKWRFIQILYERLKAVIFYQDRLSLVHPIIQVFLNILGSNYLAYFLSLGFFLFLSYCVFLTSGTDYSQYVISTQIPVDNSKPVVTNSTVANTSKVNTAAVSAKSNNKVADDPLPQTSQPTASTSNKVNVDASNKNNIPVQVSNIKFI